MGGEPVNAWNLLGGEFVTYERKPCNGAPSYAYIFKTFAEINLQVFCQVIPDHEIETGFLVGIVAFVAGLAVVLESEEPGRAVCETEEPGIQFKFFVQKRIIPNLEFVILVDLCRFGKVDLPVSLGEREKGAVKGGGDSEVLVFVYLRRQQCAYLVFAVV